MGWFSSRNATAAWVENPSTPLAVDLDAFTLNGAAIGDDATLLAFLGPGVPGELLGEFLFPARRVILEIQNGALAAFHIHTPFIGSIRFHGKHLQPEAIVGEAAWIAACGEPDVVDGAILTYTTGVREWELILDEEGMLKTVSVY